MIEAIAFDFDGTVTATFEDSPETGINVARAYELAILGLFGKSALERYRKLGGLRNRAPYEVVAELHDSFGDRLFDQAFSLGIPPEVYALRGDSQLIFTDGGVLVATELLVRRKIKILTDSVGQQFNDGATWPRPMPGFVDYWRRLSTDHRYATLVVSSGHTDFINKWFDALGLNRPDAMITDDDARLMPDYPVKPNVHLMEAGRFSLNCAFGQQVEMVALYGDDSQKDGQLARNAGVQFFHFDLAGKSEELISFKDWSSAPFPYGVLGR